MRAVVQRVHGAQIVIDHAEKRQISAGLAVFLGVMQNDEEKHADFLAEKIKDLRIFTDDGGKMNLSLMDISGEMLVVSNFTLSADCKKGRRPSFDAAAPPDAANALYERFIARVREYGVTVKTGKFGAHMDVLVDNDGPITIILDTDKIPKLNREEHR